METQLWIAVSTYLLTAIVKKRLRLGHSFHALLQILSLTLFEKAPVQQAFRKAAPPEQETATSGNPCHRSIFNRTAVVGI